MGFWLKKEVNENNIIKDLKQANKMLSKSFRCHVNLGFFSINIFKQWKYKKINLYKLNYCICSIEGTFILQS